MKMLAFFLLLTICASAETKTMTLREALDTALAQSPDVLLARLDEQKARAQVTIAHDPFTPKVFAGSGGAYTYGYPNSIDGNAPSIVQTRTVMSIYNRPQSYQVAAAREGIRAAGVTVAQKQDEVAYRVTSLFLGVEQAQRDLTAAQRHVENLTKVRDLLGARVSEGRELPLESRKADVAILRAKQQAETFSFDLINQQSGLALALGYGPGDLVTAKEEDRPPITVPESESAAVSQALEQSNELKSLESSMQSKMLEIRGFNAMRLPKVDLVAQYSLFAKYAYQNFFTRFQRNNVELGASIEIPLLAGHAHTAYAAQGEADIAKLRIEVSRTRSRIASDLREAYQEVKRTEDARTLARADLDLAREELTVDLAQMDEGRLPMATVEAARATEEEKWMAYYDAQHAADLARLNVLRDTGSLVAALR